MSIAWGQQCNSQSCNSIYHLRSKSYLSCLIWFHFFCTQIFEKEQKLVYGGHNAHLRHTDPIKKLHCVPTCLLKVSGLIFTFEIDLYYNNSVVLLLFGSERACEYVSTKAFLRSTASDYNFGGYVGDNECVHLVSGRYKFFQNNKNFSKIIQNFPNTNFSKKIKTFPKKYKFVFAWKPDERTH